MAILTGKGQFIVPPFSQNALISPYVKVTLPPNYQPNIDYNWSPEKYYKLCSISLLTYDFQVFKRFFVDSLLWQAEEYYPHQDYNPQTIISPTGNLSQNHQSSTINLNGTSFGRTITGNVEFSQQTAPFLDNGSSAFIPLRDFGSVVSGVLNSSVVQLQTAVQTIVGDINLPSQTMPLNATSDNNPLNLTGTRANYNSSGTFSGNDIPLNTLLGKDKHDLLFVGYWIDDGVQIELDFFQRFVNNGF